MKKAKFFLAALIVTILLITQFAMVSAAPPADEAGSINGTVNQVSMTTDPTTGVTTVEITLTDDQGTHTVGVSEKTANTLGLLWYDEDGNPQLVETLPNTLDIPLSAILPQKDEVLHPVANALATFFSEIPGVDYNVIMAAHEEGYGFGVIAQSLWLTQRMEGDSDVLAAVLAAKKTGDYSAFTLEDGTVPTNWGQFRKAVLAGDKKVHLGAVMSNKDHGNGSNNGNGTNNGNGNTNDHGNANNNGNKDKNKENGNTNGSNGNNGNKDNNGKNKP